MFLLKGRKIAEQNRDALGKLTSMSLELKRALKGYKKLWAHQNEVVRVIDERLKTIEEDIRMLKVKDGDIAICDHCGQAIPEDSRRWKYCCEKCSHEATMLRRRRKKNREAYEERHEG